MANKSSVMFWQVTGGAHGIGEAIAIELAKCGCNIAVADVDIEGARDTVEELHLLGVKAFAYEVTTIVFFFLHSNRSHVYQSFSG